MRYEHDHENDILYFGKTNFRNQMRTFGIKTDDRRRHMYVIGKTGMGKTTLLENLILSDIYAGHGCCYIDPHGETAEKLIDFIPSWRINDVVYFDPSDLNHPLGFNILESIDPNKRHLVASGMMGVFKKIWENVWSARMEYILNNTILALLENPNSTLLGINRMLSDKEYRKQIVSNVQDPIVKAFWVREFEGYEAKFAAEAVAPIQNKVGQFLSTPMVRNIVAQSKSTIDPRRFMDEQMIFIVNLSKGRAGEDAMRLLGGMLITKIQIAAMERVDIPEKDRMDFYLYVDEFQNFAVESFATILSEARKYRLSLILAHQYIAQLEYGGNTTVRDAVFGNVGTIVSFRVGSPDAEFMESEFMPRFTPNDLIELGKAQIYLKLMIDGVTSSPFSAVTLPPIGQRTGSAQKVIEQSRERYAGIRAAIEEHVSRWSGFTPETNVDEIYKEVKQAKEDAKKLRFSHSYICSRCKKTFMIPVELDRSRPIYCEECREIMKVEREGSKKKGDERKASRPALAPLPRTMEGKLVEKPIEAAPVSLSALAPKKEEGSVLFAKMPETMAPLSPAPVVASTPAVAPAAAIPAAPRTMAPGPGDEQRNGERSGEPRKRKRKRNRNRGRDGDRREGSTVSDVGSDRTGHRPVPTVSPQGTASAPTPPAAPKPFPTLSVGTPTSAARSVGAVSPGERITFDP